MDDAPTTLADVNPEEIYHVLTASNAVSARFPHDGRGEWMILPQRFSQPHYVPLKDRQNSDLGELDRFPMEILVLIMEWLDVQSLLRFAGCSFKGRSILHTLKAYTDLITHVSEILVALGRTTLLKHHSLKLLSRALHSSICESCLRYFGAYLFLPTCERVCLECLIHNFAFHVISNKEARNIFHLTEKDMCDVPWMRSIPGNYGIRGERPKYQPKPWLLACVKQVKMVALKVHGSMAKLEEISPLAGRELAQWVFEMKRRYRAASLTPIDHDPSVVSSADRRFVDSNFHGMASMRMPYLTNEGELDRGRPCRGCLFTGKRLTDDRFTQAVTLNAVFPRHEGEFYSPYVVDSFFSRLFTKSNFVNKHVKECMGISKLIRMNHQPRDSCSPGLVIYTDPISVKYCICEVAT